jgi:Chitin binding Peritrophin-A domain
MLLYRRTAYRLYNSLNAETGKNSNRKSCGLLYGIHMPIVVADFCKGQPDGLYVYIYNCSKFIHCSNSITYVKNCSADVRLYFNNAVGKKYCDWPQNLTPDQIAYCSQSDIPVIPPPWMCRSAKERDRTATITDHLISSACGPESVVAQIALQV